MTQALLAACLMPGEAYKLFRNFKPLQQQSCRYAARRLGTEGILSHSVGAGNPECTSYRHHTSKLVISRCVSTAANPGSCQHTAPWRFAKLLKPRLECHCHGELLIRLRSGSTWASSAPLQLISLTNNSLSGSLPDIASALSQLRFLSLANNPLEGTVPLSWLQAGSLLSHISVLNVGQVWDASLAQTNWRQELCLKKYLYDADVTGQQLALLPALMQHLSSIAY